MQLKPLVLAALASLANAASLTQVTNFGTNPTNVGMFVYKCVYFDLIAIAHELIGY
jgi:hypothetical protein